MTIESDLNRIANALEIIAATKNGVSTAPLIDAITKEVLPAKPKRASKPALTPEVQAAPVGGVTQAAPATQAQAQVMGVDKAREALKQYAIKNGTDKARALIAKYGVGNVSALPAEKLQNFFDEATCKAVVAAVSDDDFTA